MPRQAIEQATCTKCSESDNNYHITDSDVLSGREAVIHQITCTCGTEETVTIDSDGIRASENVSHEGASWREE